MTTAEKAAAQPRFRAGRVADWYLRLNGFLTIESFLLHNMRGGGIRTDADLVGVRFPHRAEMLLDDDRGPMEDDQALGLSDSLVDFGSEPSETVTLESPDAKQVTWASALAFMHSRFQRYLRQKTDVHQWAPDGKMLHRLASDNRDCCAFVRQVQACMVP